MNKPEHMFAYELETGQVAVYFVRNLWKLAANLPVEQIPTDDLIPNVKSAFIDWKEDDWNRVDEADLSYPIIIGPSEFGIYKIYDGYHRAMQAITNNHAYISAQRLHELPAPDFILASWEEYDHTEFSYPN